MNIEAAYLKMLSDTHKKEEYPLRLGFIDSLGLAEDVGYDTEILIARINYAIATLYEPVNSREEAINLYQDLLKPVAQ